jgi:uncharacterized SAM-binding protein YcdF (DUF218 family)
VIRRALRWLLRGALVLGALLLVYVCGTFVQVYRSSRHDGATKADAIIVLGAAQYNGRPSPVLQERLDHALDLYKLGYAPTVVLTGGRQAGDRFTEATTGYNYLRQHGVPDAALLKEVNGSSTWESLQAASRFMLKQHLTKVVLVTDDYHAMRVGAIADDLGFDASVSPSNTHLSAFSETKQLVRETVAVSIGRVIGYDRLLRIDDAVHGG